ncbi:MAG: metallophosphatase family protein [Dehalococcoidia bacterium]|nr:metallophosphatase family protein [Dehalococcoidia bacterium]
MATMRYAILADIHANATALSAVLEDVDYRGGVDELWCLGDIVGFGPDPHDCIEILRKFNCVCVSGNHDFSALEQNKLSSYDSDSAMVLSWTASQLTAEDTQFLSQAKIKTEKDNFTLVHGSPRQPLWEYVLSISIARENFPYFTTPYCIVGHTHVPIAYKKEGSTISSVLLSENIGLILGDVPMILNPGSVGQPRDGDSRASYAIYDSAVGVFRLHRVPYDLVSVRERIWGKGLPVRLASRLERGE